MLRGVGKEMAIRGLPAPSIILSGYTFQAQEAEI